MAVKSVKASIASRAGEPAPMAASRAIKYFQGRAKPVYVLGRFRPKSHRIAPPAMINLVI
jgi:hypothetical protein